MNVLGGVVNTLDQLESHRGLFSMIYPSAYLDLDGKNFWTRALNLLVISHIAAETFGFKDRNLHSFYAITNNYYVIHTSNDF